VHTEERKRARREGQRTEPGAGCRVEGVALRIEGVGLRIEGVGLRVEG